MMKLSEKESKLFFRRAQRRFKVSNDFIKRNISAMLKFIQYAITPRIILKRKLIRKRNRVFLRHNYLRKLIFDPTKLRKRRHAKRLHSQWSKRLVLHLRRLSVIEFVEEKVEEDENTAKAVKITKDVSQQLKEQLELLKSGKRTIPLLEDLNNSKQSENIQNSVRLYSNDINCKNKSIPPVPSAVVTGLEENISTPKVPLLKAVHITEEEFKGADTKGSEKTNGSFLDMLISKVKHTSDESGGNETLTAFETLMEPPTKPHTKFCEKESIVIEERENSNSSSDFFGFEDTERVLGNFPGMLSTPLVRKRDSNSAFVSETLNAYMRDNSLESSTAVNYPQRRPEDGQVSATSIPPKLDMPALPDGLQGLRTVAERRSFLQRTKNTKYCIINNIGTIFRELQKRSKGHRICKQAVESIMNSSSVPMTRQGWKAAAWLVTEMDNYYFQTITIDGENVRLCGGRGNFRNKYRKPHSSNSIKSISICPANCIDRMTFRTLRPVRIPEKRSKLKDSSKKVIFKPCPLSHKILLNSPDEESVFGSLGIARMPLVELEVFPQLQRPLSEIAKKYLQLILPYGKITREWAEFSVSTLLDSKNMELEPNAQKSFTFKLPYANDRNHLIIRRIYKRSEELESHFNNFGLTFRDKIDQRNANGEPPDLLSIECADVLTDMINSVAIACSENSFIKDDPDNIYPYIGDVGDEDMMEEKSVRKIDHHQQQSGVSNKKQTRLLNELKRLNATVIDAATTKSKKDGTRCEKECCKLGCICSSLNEGPIVKQHCGKQRCVLECKCKNPSVLRLETDGRKITEEDAFMLRRQATARLARVEKEFTSTIVLTGSETLLINESQYDKKRRCTKVPKRYGEYVEDDEGVSVDSKPSTSKKIEITSTFPPEPVLVNETIYNNLKHSLVRLKRLHDVKDLAPWCMVHMVYKCSCKGQSTIGNPIVIEKHEEHTQSTAIDESLVVKNRTLYSFEKEECKKIKQSYIGLGCDVYENSETSETSDTISEYSLTLEEPSKIERRGRISDNHYIEVYMNTKANHCRRVVPIPKNIYKRRNKKRVAHVQLYIAENESDETRLSLNEHVLRSVYYHKDINGLKRKTVPEVKEETLKEENITPRRDFIKKDIPEDSSMKNPTFLKQKFDNKLIVPIKKRRVSMAQDDRGSSLLLVNRYKESLKQEGPSFDHSSSTQRDNTTKTSPKFIPTPVEQITIPKISKIFSLNSGVVEIANETSSPLPEPVPTTIPTAEPEPASAIDISQGSSDDMALAHGLSSDAFKNVFKQVIKNMNNLVSKKMQDIDMALRRESKAIPAPNAEILCIIRWNNFLEAYLEGFVYLWEVQTTSLSFIAATIKPIMPLVMNALSVVNIQTIPRDKLPLLGRMLIDRKRSASSEGLAVVMQGQKMYWIVKGFLRPDKTRICPKPTPESHPLLTRKINVLCRLLINNQFNEHKKRQDALQTHVLQKSTQITSNTVNELEEKQSLNSDCNISLEPKDLITSNSSLGAQPPGDESNISLKLKVLPMQRNISDQATSILEQMVSQAYGFVRTNISFRKIRNTELCEIFPPAKMNSNHHWLVLDLSNDFSHIFIPELKDLLTLDRIQKVMDYALAKNRIVKMQFNQKSLFNAYVTPKSKKKIYFGPYRHSITTPKLVLLQSVDGQMMLREVYESRHNIIPKTFSTTAFWVVQKSGKIYLDLEPEHVMSVEANEQNTVDASHISLLNNYCNTQQTGIENVQRCHQNNQIEEENSCQISIPAKVSVQFNEECQVQQSSETPQSNQQNVHFQLGSEIEQRKQMNKIVEVGPDNEAPQNVPLDENIFAGQIASRLQTEKPDHINAKNSMDDDDDCMIVDDEPRAQITTVVPPILCAPALASQVVPNLASSADSQELNSARMNYTISYGGTNSSLVVVPNECDRDSSTMSNVISNNFTILSDAQPNLADLSGKQNCNQSMPIQNVFNFSSEDPRSMSLQSVHDSINQGEITLNVPTIEANTSISAELPVQTLTNPNEPKLDDSSISNSKNSSFQYKNEKKSYEILPNNLKLNDMPMKLNKNITIKKIITEVERNPPVATAVSYLRKSLPVKSHKPVATNTRPKYILPMEKQNITYPRASQFVQVVGQPQQKQSFVQNSSQVIRHQTKPIVQTGQRPMNEKTVRNSQQNFQQRSQGGLVVRTPTTINTIIRSQQQNVVRNQGGNTSMLRSALNSTSSGLRLRAPNAISQVERLAPSTHETVNSSLAASNIPTTTSATYQSIRKSMPGFVQFQQKRNPNTIHQTTSVQNPAKRILSTSFTRNPPPDFSKKSQFDHLQMSEGSTTAATNTNSPQSNGIQTIHETVKQNQMQSTSTNLTSSAVKRNYAGAPMSRPQFRLQPSQKLATKSISTINKVDSFLVQQSSQVKGIPIELPRLKKFAIVSSPTQNTMLPKSDVSCKKSSEAPVTVDNCVPKKLIQRSSTNPTISITPTSSTAGTMSTNANTEYGYFHANLDGLPKFVVKRVGEDFLIKVPNFNGILKLTGLSTVHNYLNQYTTQKCGKTNEEVAGLKWTFKVQDRSKLNIINKTNSPPPKANSSPSIQKLISLKNNISEQTTLTSTPPDSNINTMKQQSASRKQLESFDSIDLSDD